MGAFLLPPARFLTLLLPLLVFWGKAYVDVAASGVAALFLLHCLLTRRTDWLNAWWVRWSLLLWLYLIARSLFAEFPLAALAQSAPFIRYPMFAAALAFWVIDSRDFSRRLLWSLGLGVSLLAFDALYQYMSGFDILGKPKFTEDRLTGPFRRPRIGYTITWMLFPVISAWVMYPKRPYPTPLPVGEAWGKGARGGVRILAHVLLTLLLLSAVILSGERTPALLTLLGLGLLALLLPVIRKRLVWTLPLAALFVASLLYLNPLLYQRQVVSTLQTIQAIGETPYGKIALDARDVILRAPVFGVGPNHYRIECAKPELRFRECHPHPHNFYLELWTESGVIGLFLLLALFASWLWPLVKTCRLWQGDLLVTGLAVGILIRLWPLIMNPSFFESWNVIPLWLMVGWLFSILRRTDYFGKEHKP